MKKFLFFLMIAFFAGFAVQDAQTAPPPWQKAIVVYPSDCPSTFVASVSMYSQEARLTDAVGQVPAPADPGELLNFPGKESGWKGWLDWILGAALFVVYEILVRIKPTSKTYSILGLLYSLLNWLKADKAKGGANFKINPG